MTDERMAEREFLLRSLDDLEAEREAGNIDDDTYKVLHDDYTARAAAVIRDDTKAPPDAPEVPMTTRVLTIGVIVVFCVVAAFLLAHAVGTRRPGQTITGNAQTKVDPNSYEGHLDAARTKMGASDFSGALQEFTAAIRLDPTQPEPLTYRGWISAIVAREATGSARDTLVRSATADLDQAMRIAPKYPDAYVFKALLLFQVENKPADAVPLFQQFLVLAPDDHPMRNTVTDALAQAVAAAKKP